MRDSLETAVDVKSQNSCESAESCFVSRRNESVQLELKPISRGMHVTHNGVNELSKLKQNSSARFRLCVDSQIVGVAAGHVGVGIQKGRFALLS